MPRWATSNQKAPYVTRPDAQDFEQFMTAVARHFGSGSSLYAIWNEPNHPAFLLPQFNSNGTPASPRIYRGLYQAGYAGLQAGGLAHPQVLFGETAPTGLLDKRQRCAEKAKALLHDVAPLAFLREALCLNANYRKAGSCGELQMTGYAHHAYTLPRGPRTTSRPDADDVEIGALSRLSNALNKAAAARTRSRRTADLPDRVRGAERPQQATWRVVCQAGRFDAIAEHIAWSNPRVAAFSQYLLKDDPLGGRARLERQRRHVGFQTGLEYRQRQPQAAVLRLAGAADRHQAAATATRCGGSCARRPARPRSTVLVKRKARASATDAEDA